jgi:hypothetical protein
MNKLLIELGAARIGAAIHNVGATIDFEVLSLPGGSLIAVLLWVCASVGSIRRTATQLRGSRTTIDGGSIAAERLPPSVNACVGCEC